MVESQGGTIEASTPILITAAVLCVLYFILLKVVSRLRHFKKLKAKQEAQMAMTEEATNQSNIQNKPLKTPFMREVSLFLSIPSNGLFPKP